MRKLLPPALLLFLSIVLSLPSAGQDTEPFAYWNFNDPLQLTTPTISLTGASITSSLAAGSELISGTGQNFNSSNALNGDLAGSHLRLNLPIGSILDFNIPTVGYSQVVVKYETRRSGSGAGLQHVSYSTDGTNYIPFTTVVVVDGTPEIVTLDFTGIAATDENSNFKIRVEFELGGGGNVGNNRFDNLTATGLNNNPSVDPEIELVFPRDGATRVAFKPTFRWNGTSASYALQVSTSPSFDVLNINAQNVATAQYTHPSNLQSNTLYYWRVGSLVGGELIFSPSFSFTSQATGTSGRITYFALEARDNAGKIHETIVCDIMADNSIVGVIPAGISDFNLAPTFVVGTADNLVVSGVTQENQWTPANFSAPVTYSVVTGGVSVRQYVVRLVHTNLPVIYVNTQNAAPIVSLDDYVAATVRVIKTDGTVDLLAGTEIRGRGNSTWSRPKKPYRLKLNNAASVLGFPADRDWVLLANYIDKSLIRNRLAFYTSDLMGLSYSPRSAPVELVLNGVYQGSYQFGDHVKVSDDRVDVIEMSESDNSGDNLTGGYFLELDSRLDEDVWFRTASGTPFTLKSPEDTTPEQLNYIQTYIQNLESTLFSSSLGDPVNGYAKYMDMESFMKWYWVMELFKNNDANQYSSIFYYKQRNEKLKMGPVWDFDIAAGNIDYNNNNLTSGWWIRNGSWFSRLFQDPAFRTSANLFWNQHRNSIKSTLMSKIDQYAADLSLSQVENFRKWPILDVDIEPNAVVTGSYTGELNYLKTWLSARIDWINSQVDPNAPAKITPTIVWQKPAPIQPGTPLTEIQLNASASANNLVVPGQYVYSPASGTILPSGIDQVLQVTFVPTNQDLYESVTGSTTISVTANAPLFYRALNLNGPALVIDGNIWEASSTAPGYSATNGLVFTNQAVPLVPATDASRATMIRSSVWNSNVTISIGSMPAGTYTVYLYVWEDNGSETYTVRMEGQVVQANYVSGSAGQWSKLGPFVVNVSDGALTVNASGGAANLSGLEIWSQGAIAPTVTTPLIDQVATVGVPLNYTFAANSFSGSALTYTATLVNGSPLPAWLTFNPATRTFSGTPAVDNVGVLNIRVTATNIVSSISDDFNLTVNPAPVPPTVAQPLQDQSVNAGTPFVYVIPETSFAGSTLTYASALVNGTPLPAWLTFNPTTRTFTGTAAEGNVGVLAIRVTATNTLSSVSDDFNLTVNLVPVTPTLEQPLLDQNSNAGTPFVYVIPISSFAGSTLTYTAALVNGNPLPAWLTFTSATRTFTGTAAEGDVGTLEIRVTVTNTLSSVSDDFNLTVNPAPAMPTVAQPLQDQSVNAGTPFVYVIPASSFSGAGLVYTALLSNGSSLPPWLTFTPATRTFSGTPGALNVGTISVRVTVTNGGGSANDIVDITVNSSGVSTFYRALNLNGPALVIDGNNWEASSTAPGYSATNGLVFTNQAVPLVPATDASRATMIRSSVWNSNVTISIGSMPAGTYTVYLYVWEDNGSETYTVRMEGQVVQANYVSGSAGQWSKLGPFVVNVSDGALTVNALGGAANLSGLEIWTQGASAPTVTAPLVDQVASVGVPMNYTFATNSFSGSALTYTATLVNGSPLPAWLTFNPATRTFSGTPAVDNVGVLNIRVTATNIVSAINDDFSLTVNPAPVMPTLVQPLQDQSVNAGTPFVYVIPESSFSGSSLVYTSLLSDGNSLPPWLTFTPGTRTFSGTPGALNVGTISVRVTVTNGGGSANDIVDITVNSSGVSTFYRALNLNGPALVIDGNNWEASSTAPGYSANGLVFTNQAVPLVPATGAARATMIRSSVWGGNVTVSLGSMPANTYTVYLYVWEDNGSTTYTVSMEGQVVQANYASGGAGQWAKLGPFAVNVSDGALTVNASGPGAAANLSGLEIWTQGAPAPTAPTVTAPLLDQVATVGVPMNYTFATNSFSGSALTYTATLVNGSPLPAWLTFNPATRTFSGTPAVDNVGVLNIRVTATNIVSAISDDFSLTVNPAPAMPTLVQPLQDQSVNAGTPFVYVIPESSFSGSSLVYTSLLSDGNSLPPWLTFTPGTRTFSGTPGALNVGTISVRVTVTNGGGSANDIVDITVNSSGVSTFYRAVNLNGPALVIDGNNWEASSTAPGYSSSGFVFTNQAVPLVPATDAARATMIRSSVWGGNVTVSLGSMPANTYTVYLYVWEDNGSTTYTVSMEGQVVQANYASGGAGQWAKLGPFAVNVSDGALTVNASQPGSAANLSGLEIWTQGSGGEGAARIDMAEASLSVLPEEESVELSAYPNPFSDFVTIEFTSMRPGATVLTLMDSKGVLLETDEVTATAAMERHKVTMGSPGMSPGVYVVRLADQRNIRYLRLTVMR